MQQDLIHNLELVNIYPVHVILVRAEVINFVVACGKLPIFTCILTTLKSDSVGGSWRARVI